MPGYSCARCGNPTDYPAAEERARIVALIRREAKTWRDVGSELSDVRAVTLERIAGEIEGGA